MRSLRNHCLNLTSMLHRMIEDIARSCADWSIWRRRRQDLPLRSRPVLQPQLSAIQPLRITFWRNLTQFSTSS